MICGRLLHSWCTTNNYIICSKYNSGLIFVSTLFPHILINDIDFFLKYHIFPGGELISSPPTPVHTNVTDPELNFLNNLYPVNVPRLRTPIFLLDNFRTFILKIQMVQKSTFSNLEHIYLSTVTKEM